MLARMARPKRKTPKSIRIAPGVRVFPTDHGVYHVQFTDRSREPYRKTRTLRTDHPAEAVTRAHDLVAKRRTGDYDPWAEVATETPLGDAVRDYLAQIEAAVKRGERKPSYLRTQRHRLGGMLKAVGEGADLSRVPAQPLEAFVRTCPARAGHPARPRAAASRHSMHLSLAGFFNWCVQAGLVRTSPMADVPAPRRADPKPDFFTEAEFGRLVRACEAIYERTPEARREGKPFIGLWLRDAAQLAVSTGLRLGEVCALRWSDVERDRDVPKRLHIRTALDQRTRERLTPKWDSGGRVPVSAALVPVLQRMEARRLDGEPDDAPVVRNASGEPCDPQSLNRSLKRACETARLPKRYSFHTLRHTYASWLVMHGVEITTVSRLMRHRDITTTMRYAHLAPRHMEDAVEGVFGAISGTIATPPRAQERATPPEPARTPPQASLFAAPSDHAL